MGVLASESLRTGRRMHPPVANDEAYGIRPVACCFKKFAKH